MADLAEQDICAVGLIGERHSDAPRWTRWDGAKMCSLCHPAPWLNQENDERHS